MDLSIYTSNQSLSMRLLSSIVLYLDDMTNPFLSEDQRQQSKAAVLTLLDTALEYLNEDLTPEARGSVERIFQRIIYDVVREDLSGINKDILTLGKIKNIFV